MHRVYTYTSGMHTTCRRQARKRLQLFGTPQSHALYTTCVVNSTYLFARCALLVYYSCVSSINLTCRGEGCRRLQLFGAPQSHATRATFSIPAASQTCSTRACWQWCQDGVCVCARWGRKDSQNTHTHTHAHTHTCTYTYTPDTHTYTHARTLTFQEGQAPSDSPQL